MSMVENVRNAMVYTTVRLVFISIPLFFGLVEVCTALVTLLYFLHSAGSGRNVPRRRARSFINTKNTGTRIST
jgi:hypothetical protein